MEIILKKDVEGVGFKDDIVTVKNGFGRNFLIPKSTQPFSKTYFQISSYNLKIIR